MAETTPEQKPDLSPSEYERIRGFFSELPENIRRNAEATAPPKPPAKKPKYAASLDDHSEETPFKPPPSRRTYGPLKIRR